VKAQNTAQEKVIALTDDKIGSLLGKKSQNARLLTYKFGIKFQILPHYVCTDDEINPNATIEVIISTKSKTDNFENKVWTKEVFRYLRSATRGGFVKKLSSAEYLYMTQNAELLNIMDSIFQKIKNRYAVDILWHEFNGLAYICVLEFVGVTEEGKLEEAITAAGELVHIRILQLYFARSFRLQRLHNTK
jgi:hypothetical protein